MHESFVSKGHLVDSFTFKTHDIGDCSDKKKDV